ASVTLHKDRQNALLRVMYLLCIIRGTVHHKLHEMVPTFFRAAIRRCAETIPLLAPMAVLSPLTSRVMENRGIERKNFCLVYVSRHIFLRVLIAVLVGPALSVSAQNQRSAATTAL